MYSSFKTSGTRLDQLFERAKLDLPLFTPREAPVPSKSFRVHGQIGLGRLSANRVDREPKRLHDRVPDGLVTGRYRPRHEAPGELRVTRLVFTNPSKRPLHERIDRTLACLSRDHRRERFADAPFTD